MGGKIRERIAGREIDVVIHSREFIPRQQLAWRTRVRGGCRGSRERRRPRCGGQREYVLCRLGLAAPRGVAERRALLRGRRSASGIVARPAVLLLSAQRQSQQRAHRQCCTPITHLVPPELHPSNPVWFTRPPADRAQLPEGPVGRITALRLVAASLAGAHSSPHPCPDERKNLKKQPDAVQ